MSKPVITFVFKVLRSGLLRYILYTCPNLWKRSCSKCYGVDCVGTYFTHVQTCDNVLVQSATEWTASVHTLHMSKPVQTFVFKVLRRGLLRYILYTRPNLWKRSCSKCYGVDCFGTYFTHVQSCENVRVQSATEWTASVHTLHMSKAVITFVFKVLRNGLLWCLWLPRVALCASEWQGCTHNGADSPKTDVMKKARTLRALLLRAAKYQWRALFCVCAPLKFRYGFFG